LRAAAIGQQHGGEIRSTSKPNLIRPIFGLLNDSTKLETSIEKYQQNVLQRQAAAVKGMGGGMAYVTLKQRALMLRTCKHA
jgi:hypothetical protein